MKIKNILNEIQAEIVKGVIPAKKVFDLKGNIIPLEKLKGSQSQALLRAIKSALIRQKMLDQFNPDDMSSVDIKPDKMNPGTYILTADNGKKYKYHVNSGRITDNV